MVFLKKFFTNLKFRKKLVGFSLLNEEEMRNVEGGKLVVYETTLRDGTPVTVYASSKTGVIYSIVAHC